VIPSVCLSVCLYVCMVGCVAQWLERRSVTDELSLTLARSVADV